MSGASGPLLRAVLTSQQTEDELLSHGQIGAYAAAVAERLHQLRASVLSPVGRGADRLAGAVSMLDAGHRTDGWNLPLAGEVVLIVGTVGVGSVQMAEAASLARARGAREVHAAAISPELCPPRELVDSWHVLAPAARLARHSA